MVGDAGRLLLQPPLGFRVCAFLDDGTAVVLLLCFIGYSVRDGDVPEDGLLLAGLVSVRPLEGQRSRREHVSKVKNSWWQHQESDLCHWNVSRESPAERTQCVVKGIPISA